MVSLYWCLCTGDEERDLGSCWFLGFWVFGLFGMNSCGARRSIEVL